MSITSMLVAILLMLSAPAAAQVTVSVKTEKSRFLVGEPIVVVVQVTNVGTEALGYGSRHGGLKMTVPNAKQTNQRTNELRV